MPFVQRVVQPVNIAQVVERSPASTSASVSGKAFTKFSNTTGKCTNNNCINKQDQQSQQNGFSDSANGEAKVSVKDTLNVQQQELLENGQQTITTALVHTQVRTLDSSVLEANQTNGFTSSFTYATDTEEELTLTNLRVTTPTSPIPTAQLPIKKLKQHVEFLSTAPSPSRNHSRSADSRPSARSSQAHHRRRTASAPQSPTAARVVAGYEFDSISNITLSNALRQLASLVLLASDIFDDLQKELQNIGDRSLVVRKKIIAVEQRVSAYDPKTVTVPESDLLTFAQRKVHYESKKLFESELFTKDTRPHSVRQLYDNAGKVTPPRPLTSLFGLPHSPSNINGLDDISCMADITDTGVLNGNAAGSDECVCTPVFGRANRTMRTRIDAEIEIRLPAGIEDLRKWTSTEALGDVTVTPDCMHHVDTSISTSIIIGDNGVLTPALSPSVLSADAVDAMYSINASNLNDNLSIPNDINKDVPLNHRLPSPEEQLKIIALRYPAEVISVDTSGKRFQRMCMARKSTTGCYSNQMSEANNLNEDVQTVSRRSRSRKARGKRRNTIAGMDQKEIQDAANGDSTMASGGENRNTLATNGSGNNAANAAEDSRRSSSTNNDKNKKFGRSKSSDILKKDSVALPYDKGKSTLTRLNSLKQWGRNRFKFMHRNEAPLEGILDTSGSSEQSANTSKNSQSNNTSLLKNSSSTASPASDSTVSKGKARNIDDECVVHDLIKQKSESRFSHERKPSYSSSEKSMSVSSSGHLRGKLHLATCGNVKLRDTSSLNRQRRNGILANGFSNKDEQPHSSSGNWSASSESGRASIGSEITIQPKSSASNTSLNVSSFHPGSGPPSSMLSRRRFMNTSASSSVTSEGTATPELQVVDGAYPNHMDDETCSAYSCDTEGYYTSFHMDSGLRTLKEEEPPSTPLQASQNLHTSSYSFGSQSNQTILTAENEYELFGRGSTSTTTSSAGTVCTTLMMTGGEQSSLNSQGPEVPERISSLGKLNRNSQSISASSSTLERSYSSSTIGSTLERTGTIKRNVNAGLKLSLNEASNIDGEEPNEEAKAEEELEGERERRYSVATPESQDADFDFDQKIRKRAAQPLPANALIAAEMDCSESSDLEGVERIERIKQKTALNANRIPSMCIITPTTSDDENHSKDAFDPNKTLTNESSPTTKAAAKAEASLLKANKVEDSSNIYSSIVDNLEQHVEVEEAPRTPSKKETFKDHNLNVVKRSPPFNNMLEKLKVVLPNIKRSPVKASLNKSLNINDDALYDPAGEYVYIADISNNNRHNQMQAPKMVGNSSLGIYYSSDIVRRKEEDNDPKSKQQNYPTHQQTKQKHFGLEQEQDKEHLKENFQNKASKEYVSLNELPLHLRRLGNQKQKGVVVAATNCDESNKKPFTTNESEVEKLYETESLEGADSVQPAYVESSTVPMYAEISELREEKSLYSPLSGQKGARVRVNAQGKIIYDSDSLKRRKGAHTTFAPGPFVKETESALPVPINTINNFNSDKANDNLNINDYATTKAARLLLLNGGVAATRKIANVRPIVATSPLTRIASVNPTKTNNQQQQQQQQTNRMSSLYVEQAQNSSSSYQEQKQLMANQTNPFFQNNLAMMPSPSTKSTSSTGSTISSTPSTLTTSSSHSSQSASSRDETGYQPFYKAKGNDFYERQDLAPSQGGGVYETVEESFNQKDLAAAASAAPFQRNNQVYWTLQSRKQAKPVSQNSASSRDDLYATPIRRSERMARAAAIAAAANAQNDSMAGNTNSNMSPIIPRNRNGAFLTSTPTRDGMDLENLKATLLRPTGSQQSDTPERLKTCADRIGQSKTTLMDFKKLLLAKSAKSSPVQRKVSAVELLKKNNAPGASGSPSVSPTPLITIPSATVSNDANKTSQSSNSSLKTLNSSMKLLDLSGSPKTFANRRMIRQGQFGSPSKTLTPKIKPSPMTWRSSSVQRTDVMSSTIVEATISEEEKSNTSGSGASNTSRASSVGSDTIETNYDIKQNFFIQSDENNFMRSELKTNLNRMTNSSNSSINSSSSSQSANNKFNKSIPVGIGSALPTAKNFVKDSAATFTATVPQSSPNHSATTMPALETAL